MPSKKASKVCIHIYSPYPGPNRAGKLSQNKAKALSEEVSEVRARAMLLSAISFSKLWAQVVCVFHIKPFFLPVDIQHNYYGGP